MLQYEAHVTRIYYLTVPYAQETYEVKSLFFKKRTKTRIMQVEQYIKLEIGDNVPIIDEIIQALNSPEQTAIENVKQTKDLVAQRKRECEEAVAKALEYSDQQAG